MVKIKLKVFLYLIFVATNAQAHDNNESYYPNAIMFKPIDPVTLARSKSSESINGFESLYLGKLTPLTVESSTKTRLPLKDIRHAMYFGTKQAKQCARLELREMAQSCDTTDGLKAALTLLNITKDEDTTWDRANDRAAALSYFYKTDIIVPQTAKMKAEKQYITETVEDKMCLLNQNLTHKNTTTSKNTRHICISEPIPETNCCVVN